MPPSHIPFVGERPDVKLGDTVWCRTIADTWWQTTARSGPRFDDDRALFGRCYLTVAVGPWGDLESVNWPAEDVRTEPPEDVSRRRRPTVAERILSDGPTEEATE